jgi:hypothetical protein
MDPVSLVMGALAVGVSNVVTAGVQDAYTGLRSAVLRRVRRDRGGDERAEQVVRDLEHQASDAAAQPALREAVDATGLAADEQVLAAARQVLTAADPAGARIGKYLVDLRDARGVQIGDNSTMTINF